MTIKPFLPGEHEGDVSHYWRDNGDGTSSIIAQQDVGPRLELNRYLADNFDGYTSPDRDMRSVCYIPAIIRDKWLAEEGWDAYQPKRYAKELVRKLNDPDWRYLRTSHGTLAAVNGRVR